MVDSRAGATNIQREPGAFIVPERKMRCSKKKIKKKKNHNDGGMSLRDTGTY